MEIHHQQDPPSAGELVRSMALSSAELWHEILERLREVQESQVRLAGAIEGLGMMVRDAIAPDDQPIIGAHSKGAAMARGESPQLRSPEPTTERSAPPNRSEPRSEGPPTEPPPPARSPEPLLVEPVFGFKTEAANAETSVVNAGTPTPTARSETADVSEPLFAAEVPEPLFYVPPLGERVLTLSAVVDLTPSALDAVLAEEFADVASPSPESESREAEAISYRDQHLIENGDRHRAGNPKTDPSEVLDILLGTAKTAAALALAAPERLIASAPPPPLVATPLPSVVESAPPPPPPPPVVATAPPPPPAPVFESAPPPPPPPVVESNPTAEDEVPPSSGGAHPLTSAASMATEILAATPEDAAAENPNEAPGLAMISEDLTLIARGRRKRFRIH